MGRVTRLKTWPKPLAKAAAAGPEDAKPAPMAAEPGTSTGQAGAKE